MVHTGFSSEDGELGQFWGIDFGDLLAERRDVKKREESRMTPRFLA